MNTETFYSVALIPGGENYAKELNEAFAKEAPVFQVRGCRDLEKAMEELLEKPADIILLDGSNPQNDPLGLLLRLRTKFPEIPVVGLAADSMHPFARQAVHSGALDCLVKSSVPPEFLKRVLVWAIERQEAHNLLSDLSLIDALTGLFNRKGFLMLAEQRMKFSVRSGKPLKIIFVEIGGLGEINRTLGHAEGDLAVKSIAQKLKGILRGSDILGRFGPSQFAAAVEDCDGAAEPIAERIRRSIGSLATGRRTYPLTAAIGFSEFHPDQPRLLPMIVDEAAQQVRAEAQKLATARVVRDEERRKPARSGRKRILLVDDDKSMLQMLNRRLDHSGYEVIEAHDGRDGLETARREFPDLVVLDLRLPGYSGEEICKAIREDGDKDFARTPIIMLTGKTADVDRVIGMVIGANCYLTKPCRSQDLLRNIRKLLGGGAVHVA